MAVGCAAACGILHSALQDVQGALQHVQLRGWFLGSQLNLVSVALPALHPTAFYPSANFTAGAQPPSTCLLCPSHPSCPPLLKDNNALNYAAILDTAADIAKAMLHLHSRQVGAVPAPHTLNALYPGYPKSNATKAEAWLPCTPSHPRAPHPGVLSSAAEGRQGLGSGMPGPTNRQSLCGRRHRRYHHHHH